HVALRAASAAYHLGTAWSARRVVARLRRVNGVVSMRVAIAPWALLLVSGSAVAGEFSPRGDYSFATQSVYRLSFEPGEQPPPSTGGAGGAGGADAGA